MMQPQWKEFISEVVLFGGFIAPLYHLVIQLIKLERQAAITRSEIKVELKHLAERVEGLENWRSANSGFKL